MTKKPAPKSIQPLVEHLLLAGGIQEMTGSRGKKWSQTHSYQLRVKPCGTQPLPQLLQHIEAWLCGAHSQQFGITAVKVCAQSVHSSKFSSLSGVWRGVSFDIVVAMGGNRGERLEQELVRQLCALVHAQQTCTAAERALAALSSVDSSIQTHAIAAVIPRTGSTKRSITVDLEHTGKIIADFSLIMRDGSERLISLKARNGATLANFGCGDTFTTHGTGVAVNTHSLVWQDFLGPLGLCPERIRQGLDDYVRQQESPALVTDTLPQADHRVHAMVERFWGLNYYYLREGSARVGWQAARIDRNFMSEIALKNLKITEIRYPNKNRKQASIFLQSDFKRYKMDIRNSKGGLIPTDIKFALIGHTQDQVDNK